VNGGGATPVPEARGSDGIWSQDQVKMMLLTIFPSIMRILSAGGQKGYSSGPSPVKLGELEAAKPQQPLL
jgi:hypothetical protein